MHNWHRCAWMLLNPTRSISKMGTFVASVASSLAIGFVWYHPRVFGDKWCKMAHPGKKITDATPGRYGFPMSMAVTTLANIGTNLLLQASIRKYLGTVGVEETMGLGALLSMLSSVMELPHVMFGGRPVGLFAIDKGYDVAILLTSSAIFGCLN